MFPWIRVAPKSWLQPIAMVLLRALLCPVTPATLCSALLRPDTLCDTLLRPAASYYALLSPVTPCSALLCHELLQLLFLVNDPLSLL